MTIVVALLVLKTHCCCFLHRADRPFQCIDAATSIGHSNNRSSVRTLNSRGYVSRGGLTANENGGALAFVFTGPVRELTWSGYPLPRTATATLTTGMFSLGLGTFDHGMARKHLGELVVDLRVYSRSDYVDRFANRADGGSGHVLKTMNR